MLEAHRKMYDLGIFNEICPMTRRARPARIMSLPLGFAFLIIFSSLRVAAQSDKYRFSRLDISQGLSHNEVTSFFRDQKGFLWLGTMSGLNRYDGSNFKIFRHDLRDPTSINDDFISQIWEGPGKRLWIATRKGFVIYDPRTEKFDHRPQSLFHSAGIISDSIADIRKDTQGNYWFLVRGSGLYRYDSSGRFLSHFAHRQKDSSTLYSDEPTSFAADSHGDWWIVYSDGVLEKMDVKSGKIIFITDVVQKNFSHGKSDYHLYIDAHNDCWLYMYSRPEGVFWYDPSSGVYRPIRREEGRPGLNTNLVTAVVQDDKGLIWIATDHGGINLLDKKDFSIHYLLAREDDDKSLSQNSINALYKDNTGIIWAGTFKKGASYYHEDVRQFPLYRHKPSDPGSLPYDDVNRFLEDVKGNLWIGTNGGGLIYFNRASGKYIQYLHRPSDPGSLCNDVIVSLCLDHKQLLWIGTYFGGLDCFDGKTFRHYRHKDTDSNSIGDDRIWEIHEDSRERLWIGTFAAGLDLFDRERNVFVHHRPVPAASSASVPASGTSPTFPSVHSGYISELMEDTDGNLWIGTERGIDVLEAGTDRYRHYANEENNPNSLSNDNVISIIEDGRSLIWIGTHDGLDLFDKKTRTFTTFRIGDGLPDNTVLTMLEDASHNLWLGTPNGLSNVFVSKDAHTGRYTCRFENYDQSQGLQGREFNENAALRTRAGEMIFGGANGFNLFNPQDIRVHCRNTHLVLTDFQVFNRSVGIGEPLNGHVILPQSITATKTITLRYNENVFSVGFAALDFLHTEKVKYAYMLDGFNKGWLVSADKAPKAVYTNLDPGDYTFKVRTVNEDGVFGAQVLELGIKILPPFWKTPLAYIVYTLLLIGILVFARRMILRRANARFALQQERREAQRLHELDMMKIRFFTNVSHEFRTPLSLILTPLDKIIRNTTDQDRKEQFHLIYRNARRLLNMVNQLLDFRKFEVQELRLNPAHADIVRFIKELSYSFVDIAERKNIHFSFDASLSTFFTSFDQDKLERIVFNLLSNAFKFTPEHGQVKVTVGLQRPADPESPPLLQLVVKDTGIGIEKDKQEKIFDRFFQNDVPGSMINQGSGIGLAITKEFVKLHKGTIAVESEPGHGTSITVSLPVVEFPAPIPGSAGLPDPAPEEISTEQEALSRHPPVTALAASPAGSSLAGIKKPVVLLVEDNEDFRFYLKDNLKEFFTIIEASNGKEGWQKTLGSHPGLVVSDISMPEMNGIDLCRKIRSDSRTTFIPVILLTALLGEEQQLKGLETGASDYMTKPFNFEILLSKIRNLLTQQETARKTWQKQVEARPAAIKVESPDEKFIRQALELIEKNISNADFSVEEMSRELYLSRVAIYKKIHALTGKTPVELIRSIRLKRAVQLLEKSRFTVAEIAYEVGFNDPKYFSRHFKAEFGIPPSAYQRSVN
jgi:signal transduction histidine kinase/ligand-binding sensor domain-containing protein/DNA-binding response OmpR family regulator